MRVGRQFFVLTLLLATVAFAASHACAQGTTEAYFEFRVSPRPETFVFKLTNPNTIQQARDILTTGNQKIVLGTIINSLSITTRRGVFISTRRRSFLRTAQSNSVIPAFKASKATSTPPTLPGAPGPRSSCEKCSRRLRLRATSFPQSQ